jgi:Protein kinase domain/FHA domain
MVMSDATFRLLFAVKLGRVQRWRAGGGVVAGDSSAQLGGLLARLGPGSRVAGYLLERLAGAGGMAAVFRARDERLGRVVALKLLAAGLPDDGRFRERFVREARAVAAVDHPHIIPVYEAGEADGVPFIAMRFVAGGDLRVVVGREGALSVGRAAAFLSAVASALDAAHASGLVHRDVKPANMLVDAGPGRPEHVYLSDFGLARGVLSSSGLTGAGQFLGTPEYAAPEQITGREVDGRADQYGLACVAHTLLTGSPPFERTLPMALLYAHVSEPPPQLTAVRPDLSDAVDQVLARALAKAPEHRYGSCGAFAGALREALGVGPYDSTGAGHPPTVTVRAAAATARETAVLASGASAGPATLPAAMTSTAPLTMPPNSLAAQSPAAAPSPVPAATPPPAAQAPSIPPVPQAPAVKAGHWSAVVTADRAYYDSVQATSSPDAASIRFPAYFAEQRFLLSGTEVRIGRRSMSRGITPEIDLTGPPTDPGVSRLHATLIAGPDGNWSVVDSGSPNGTVVNGGEIQPGKPVPLRDGDHIHLGAWTRITIIRG